MKGQTMRKSAIPVRRRERIPQYRRHSPTGQAVVTLGRRDIYLGRWNTAASRAEYDRLIGEWLAGGRRLPCPQSDLTVVELIRQYWRSQWHPIQPENNRVTDL